MGSLARLGWEGANIAADRLRQRGGLLKRQAGNSVESEAGDPTISALPRSPCIPLCLPDGQCMQNHEFPSTALNHFLALDFTPLGYLEVW